MKKGLIKAIVLVLCVAMLSSCGEKEKKTGENQGIRYDGKPYVVNIVDKSTEEGVVTAQALEEIYKDEDNNKYYLPSIRSSLIICTLSDGSEMNIKEALEGGNANVSDLGYYGIAYYVEDKDGNFVAGDLNQTEEQEVKDDGRRY